MRLLELVYI